MKIDLLNQQNMQLGLYLEFIVEHLLAMEAPDGSPLFSMEVGDFQPWAEARLQEIQGELAAQQAAAATTDAESLLGQLPQGMGSPIDLNLEE
jgi:hypothetical protein